MTDKKKKRASLLDGLATASTAAAPMAATNRALRSARDAVDGHNVWDLDPWMIEDTRIADRLDPADVVDLREAIETNGQTVPILVRRDPTTEGKYLLVYGRRRLEAIRSSDTITRVRALIANMDDNAAVRAQISENMARRDLSFIEKALFAKELIEQGFGKQYEVAEILTVPKSAISMALGIIEAVTPALARAIGPAHDVGRPRWDKLGRLIVDEGLNVDTLVSEAQDQHTALEVALTRGETLSVADPSTAVFDHVMALAERHSTPPAPTVKPAKAPTKRRVARSLEMDVALQRKPQHLQIEIANSAFAEWLESHADTLITDLHARFVAQAYEDPRKTEKGGT